MMKEYAKANKASDMAVETNKKKEDFGACVLFQIVCVLCSLPPAQRPVGLRHRLPTGRSGLCVIIMCARACFCAALLFLRRIPV